MKERYYRMDVIGQLTVNLIRFTIGFGVSYLDTGLQVGTYNRYKSFSHRTDKWRIAIGLR